MKIGSVDNTQQAIEQTPKPKTKQAGESFESILSEEATGASGTSTPSGSRNIQGPPPGAPLPMSSVSAVDQMSLFRTQALRTLEDTMSLLERYRSELLDPSKTLKDLAPTIEALKSALKDIEEMIEAAPAGDPLRDLLTQAAVPTYNEVARFEQGYFL
jgi:hypothetical protein